MTTMPRRGILAYACIIAAIALLGAVVYFHATDNHTLLRPLAPTTAALAAIALLIFVTCDLEVIAWARRRHGKFIAWKVRRGKPLDRETLINLDRVAYEIAVLRKVDDLLAEAVAQSAAFKVLDEYSLKDDPRAAAYALHLLDRYRTHRTNHTRQANHA